MDYNLWQELILGSTKPFRTGANILAQNWGSALTGKDMSQSQNQGKFLKWLAGGITPEEQREISERPYLSALKSGAGMASTLAPFASQSLRVAQLANNPVTNKIAQLASQGALEGGMGGFGYSRQGKELEDTLTGALLGAGGEIGFEALRNRSFRKMLGEAGTYVDPTTGQRMYKGGIDIGNNNETINVFRGEGGEQSGKNAIYGRGKYVAESKNVAQKYGDVSEYSFKKKDIFDTDKKLDSNILKRFIENFSKSFGIDKNKIKDSLDTYEYLTGKSSYYNSIKQAVKNLISDRFERSGRGMELAEESVAEVINKTLKEEGYKGLKASEVVSDRPTGEIIYNIFDESLLKKAGEKTTDTTVGDMIKLDQIQTRWGGAGNNVAEILEKIKKGGDDALDAEAKYIGQVWNNMDEDLKRQAWNRLDEISSQMRSSSFSKEVESLISKLKPPEGIIPLSRPTRGSMYYIGKDNPTLPAGSIGNQLLLDAEAVKYPSGKRIIDEEDMRENLKRIIEIINAS